VRKKRRKGVKLRRQLKKTGELIGKRVMKSFGIAKGIGKGLVKGVK